MTDQSMCASARDSNGGAGKVSPHQQLAHRRPADIARADKHDMHGPYSFLDGPRTVVQYRLLLLLLQSRLVDLINRRLQLL